MTASAIPAAAWRPTSGPLWDTADPRGYRSDAAVEQQDAAVGALGLKMLHDGPIVINVRPAADPYCSADCS